MRNVILAALALSLAACSTPNVGTTSPLPASVSPNDTAQRRSDLPRKAKAHKITHLTGGYAYHGCSVYSTSDLFFTNISGSSVDPYSATIISQLPSTSNFDTDDQADERVNLGTSATTTYTAGSVLHGHSPAFYGNPPVPFVLSWFIEPLADGHAVSLLTDTCADFESYQTTFAFPATGGTPLHAFDGQENDLTSSWASQAVQGHDAMTQSGVPFLGTVDYGEDALLSAISHVLAMMGQAGAGVSQWGYLDPATNPSFVRDTGCTVGGVTKQPCAHPMHEGERLRLKSGYDCTSQGSPPVSIDALGQLVCNQLKTYGIMYTDEASTYQLRFGENTSGGKGWPTYSTDLQPLLANLHITDFEVIQEGTLHCAGTPCY